ncbi:MAG: hypothetical protein P4M05_35850 [Bradyrhizobium sp.]|nr:hypothetical protein [Bradyrhizobium sp.]
MSSIQPAQITSIYRYPVKGPSSRPPPSVALARNSSSSTKPAAEPAIDIGARTYGSVKSILDNHLDRRSAQKRATDGTPILHANIRGPRYYN